MPRRSTWHAAARFRSIFSRCARRATSNAHCWERTSVPSSPTSCRPREERSMPANEVINDVKHRMDSALTALQSHFKTLRTGRANAAMLDGVTVDYYGTPTPIAQAANVKIPEPALIVVEPWDKSMVAVIEKAIRNSDLGFNPAS